MSFRSILLNSIAIILYLAGIFWFVILIMFWFSTENNIPTEYYAETLGYFVGLSLMTTVSAILILSGWLIQKNLRKRKARLAKLVDTERY